MILRDTPQDIFSRDAFAINLKSVFQINFFTLIISILIWQASQGPRIMHNSIDQDGITETITLSKHQFDGLVQDYSISIANTLELLQSCTKQLIILAVR